MTIEKKSPADNTKPAQNKAQDDSELRFEVRDSVAHIIFNRPGALNAINIAMAVAFQEAIATVTADSSIRVLVLRGEGRAFMAGGDISQMVADPVANPDRIIQPLHQALAQMAELPIPVVAVLHGAVAGAGMSIALAADLAMASDDLRMQMAYTKIGASPDASGSWHLARLVGLRKAMEITLLSDTISAPQALDLGLVNWVVPAAELGSRSEELCSRLSEGAIQAFGRSKALLRAATLRSLPEQLEAERQAFRVAATGAEFHEGTRAFLQKRRPDFAAPPAVQGADRKTLT